MARGNLFLGQARGKVGSIVFARAFGQQITRTRPTSVANPKTYAQNVQRAILATVAKEAALLTPIVDHSFANVAYGAESVRHFRKLNMGILRNMFFSGSSNMNLSAKGANAVPNALKISEGNLPAFSAAYQDDQVGFYMGGTLPAVTSVTVENFKIAYPYLQGGDQLTIVKLVKTSGTLVNNDAVFALKVDRVVFATNAFDDPNATIIADTGYFNTTLLDMTKTTSETAIQGVDAGAGKGIGCITDNDDTYAAALILSRKVNNVWQRSTQFLEMSEYDDWTSIEEAIDSYAATSSLSEATEYLNQADEATPATGLRGGYLNVDVYKNGSSEGATVVEINDDDETTIEMQANDVLSITAIGYNDPSSRLVTCEIDGPDGGHLAHASAGKPVNWMKTIESSADAGTYKVVALYQDGSKAEYDIVITFA